MSVSVSACRTKWVDCQVFDFTFLSFEFIISSSSSSSGSLVTRSVCHRVFNSCLFSSAVFILSNSFLRLAIAVYIYLYTDSIVSLACKFLFRFLLCVFVIVLRADSTKEEFPLFLLRLQVRCAFVSVWFGYKIAHSTTENIQ